MYFLTNSRGNTCDRRSSCVILVIALSMASSSAAPRGNGRLRTKSDHSVSLLCSDLRDFLNSSTVGSGDSDSNTRTFEGSGANRRPVLFRITVLPFEPLRNPKLLDERRSTSTIDWA